MSNSNFRELKKISSLIIGLAYMKVLFLKKLLRTRLASRLVLRRIYVGLRFNSHPVKKKITVKIQSVRGYLFFIRAFLGLRFTKSFESQTNSSSLLLILPDDYNLVSANYNGGTKDIQSLHEQIEIMKLRYECF